MSDALTAPLPERMRPQTLDEYVGQEHLIGPGRLLSKVFTEQKLLSVVLWGPPGTGKTTLAKLLAQQAGARFVELSAVATGAKELREQFQAADEERRFYGTQTVLFVDEIHRYSKAQQDVLLPAVEHGTVYLIGSTTQNPRICLTSALLSRMQVCQLYALKPQHVETVLTRALKDPERGYGDYAIDVADDAWRALITDAGGDLRKGLHALEWAIQCAWQPGQRDIRVTMEHVREASQGVAGQFDETVLYDMLSAFGKSLRGSDSDAALYWFMRMTAAGLDPRIPVRRLIVHASEDVGLASPQAMPQAVAALQALESVGMPEARIPVAQAIIFVCEAPKSNSVVTALDRVQEAIMRAPHAEVPKHLRDKSYPRADDGTVTYRYPHDYPEHYIAQQYLPDACKNDIFYRPGALGTESRISPRKW